MNILYKPYPEIINQLPAKGQHILAHQTDDLMVVYQAYKPTIAAYAVANQRFGGTDYSFMRMSWIKPNFLWMMYRCGWAEKENQERVLAIWIDKSTFVDILSQAVFSSFVPGYYDSHEHWRSELAAKEVRLQWDPDHDPYGNKQERRAIQLGLKGDVLKSFNSRIRQIEDITLFVTAQKQLLDVGEINELLVPAESVFRMPDEELNRKFGIE